MVSELAAAREREVLDRTRTASMQAELARAARLNTMGRMAASIAHEINQPLSAIVSNGSAGLRWLARTPPNLDEARRALDRIVNQDIEPAILSAAFARFSQKATEHGVQ